MMFFRLRYFLPKADFCNKLVGTLPKTHSNTSSFKITRPSSLSLPTNSREVEEVVGAITNTKPVEAAELADPQTTKGKGISNAATATLVLAKTIVPFSLNRPNSLAEVTASLNSLILRPRLPHLSSTATTITSAAQVLNRPRVGNRGVNPVVADLRSTAAHR